MHQDLRARKADNYRSVRLTFLVFFLILFLCQLLTQQPCYCMPLSGDVNLGLIDWYRPFVNQLPESSSWNYLFEHFNELKSVIETCNTGHLISADDMYEYIQQLYLVQLRSLLDSLIVTFRNISLPVMEQYVLITDDVFASSGRCLNNLEQVAQNIYFVRGINISNIPLDESLPVLMQGINLPYEIERFYAAQVQQHAQNLYINYGRLFSLIYSFE